MEASVLGPQIAAKPVLMSTLPSYEPFAKPALASESPGSAYLGISVNSPYYSRRRLVEYLRWSSRFYDKFAFLIGDEIAAYTVAVFRTLPLDVANARVEKRARDVESAIAWALATSSVEAKVVRWRDLRVEPLYDQLLTACRVTHERDDHFARRVRQQVAANLTRRENLFCTNSRCEHVACGLLDSYVIEEIAGLITMSEEKGYATEIYPGRDLFILDDVYGDRFPALSQVLPRERQRRFVSLTFE